MTKKTVLAATQPRAIRTRTRLLEALETLLKQHDFSDIAVADIARTAKVSVGSVYSHFKDKEAFLVTLLERRLQILQERIAAQIDAPGAGIVEAIPDLASAMEAAVKSAIAQIEQDAHITRALAAHHRKLPNDISARAEAVYRASRDATEAFLELYRDEITAMPVRDAANFVNWFLRNIFYQRAVGIDLEPPADMLPDEDTIIRSLTMMLVSVLTAPKPS